MSPNDDSGSAKPLGLVPALILYAAAFAVLLPFLRFHIDSDGISYIDIARHYADGNFVYAINGYWGPLLSWLMTPLLAAGVPALIAAKTACFIGGIPLLAGIKKLCRLFALSARMETAVMLVAVVMALSFFVQLISPDLLIAGIMALYLSRSLDENIGANQQDGVACGVLGAAGYFAKSYAMPFFIVHFTAVCMLRRRWSQDAQRRARLTRTWVMGVAAFAVACSPWVTLLSMHYGRFTVNTTGAYNRAVVGPSYMGHPVAYEGFFKPANPLATSVWEDPSQIPVRPWSMFDSAEDLRHQAAIAVKNVMAEMDAFQSISFFALAILLVLAVLSLEEGETAHLSLLALLSIAIYCAGYVPIVVRARYLYPAYILLLVAGGKLAGEVLGRISLSRTQKGLAATVFFASFLVSPAINIAGSINESRDVQELAASLSRVIGSGRTISSNARWMETLNIASLTKSRYIGQAAIGMNPRTVAITLDLMGADYFIAWNENPLHPEGWVEISEGQLPGLLVFAPPPKSLPRATVSSAQP
jgi:hypothetical protein